MRDEFSIVSTATDIQGQEMKSSTTRTKGTKTKIGYASEDTDRLDDKNVWKEID